MQFCREPGCPEIAKTGLFCDVHKNSTTLSLRNRHPREVWYTRASWRGKFGIRLWKLKRNSICEYVSEDGQKCEARACQVHHTDAHWKDEPDETRAWFLFMGGYNAELLMSLCAKCHSKITMESIAAGEAVRHNKE